MVGDGAGSGGRRQHGARDVLVYTRTGCMFCKQVEDMLSEASIVFRSKLVEERDEQERLCERYGALSFPLVLAGSRYVGGFTYVVRLHLDGRLGLLASDDPGATAAPLGSERPVSRPRAGGLSGYAALGAYLKNKDKE